MGLLQFARVTVMMLSVLSLVSCGLFGKKDDKQPLYYSATETPPLQVPEGLDTPTSSGALIIATPMVPLPQREMSTIPPRVSSQSTGELGVGSIQWSSEGAFLLIEDTKESVIRRLGLVIKRSGLAVNEMASGDGYNFQYTHNSKDPDQGFFSKLAFWRDDAPNYSGSYQAVAKSQQEDTLVFIRNADGSDADPDAAEHLLAILGERLG